MIEYLTVLIECNKDKSVLHELLVARYGVDQVLQVLLGVGDVGVVGIVGQSGSVEHVLGSVLALGNIGSEVLLGIDNVLATSRAPADVVKGHERVVLARFNYQ
jgi:hypothetical protein